jgi:hypothetical protein
MAGGDKRSASFTERLILEFVAQKELSYDGVPWLDDVEAERWVIHHVWNCEKPPAWLDASHFYYSYHKYIYQLSVNVGLRAGEEPLNARRVVGIECLRKFQSALEDFPSYEERCRLIGQDRAQKLEAIDAIGERPHMSFPVACRRVYELSWRRRAHYTAGRLGLLLEQSTLDDKDMRKTFGILRDQLTELFRVRREDGGGRSSTPTAPANDVVQPLRQSGTVRCAPRDDQEGDGTEGPRPHGVPPLPPAPHGLPQRKRSVS